MNNAEKISTLPLKIGLTPGAEDGVGPELLVKALALRSPCITEKFLWCGDLPSLELGAKRAQISFELRSKDEAILKNGISVTIDDDIQSKSMLERQVRFLESSVKLAKGGHIDAIVTGPIAKAALSHFADGTYPGQTEFFAHHLNNEKKPFMAFMGGPFLLSLLTTHLPLKKVVDEISVNSITAHLRSVAAHCSRIYQKKLSQIKIVVLSINPHAGEGGLIGNEEESIMKPAIARAQQEGLLINGPLAADGFFAYYHLLSTTQIPDVVVASYHDQGLIAYKLLANGSCVNVTLGLTHPRTSPAHGTANELVGLNRASPLSTQEAINTAIMLTRIARKIPKISSPQIG